MLFPTSNRAQSTPSLHILKNKKKLLKRHKQPIPLLQTKTSNNVYHLASFSILTAKTNSIHHWFKSPLKQNKITTPTTKIQKKRRKVKKMKMFEKKYVDSFRSHEQVIQ